MRVSRLSLTRYGKFTDQTIEFGPQRPDAPDFHIVYGDNEAGKTTTLNAYLDLLFGIPKQSDYSFLHHNEMEVGGIIDFQTGTREFRRIKRAANTLLDTHGLPIPDASILVELDGLTRNDYALKFSLDADKLRDGGKTILASRGDLGELLFAGSADVAELSQKLAVIRAEADEFYREGGRSQDVKRIKDQIKALDDERKRLDTIASKFAGFNAELRSAGEDWHHANDTRAKASNAKAALERLETALPLFDTLAEIDAAIAALDGVPDLAPELAAIIAEFQREAEDNAGNLKAARKNIADWTTDLEKITLDQRALDVAARIDMSDLDKKRAEFITADNDLQRREEARATEAAKIAEILSAIGCPSESDPKSLKLDAPTTAQLKDLITEKTRLDAKLESAQGESDAAVDDVATARASLLEAQLAAGVGGVDAHAFENLEKLSDNIRKAGLENVVRQAARGLKRQQEELDEAIKPLAPWNGTLDDLACLRLPDAAQIEGWKTDLEAAEKAEKSIREKISELETERAELVARREAAEITGALADEAAETTRRLRDEAWTRHRTDLQAASADAFHKQMTEDDAIAAARLRHANAVADLNATVAQIAVKTAAISRQNELLTSAKEKVAATRRAFSEVILRVSDKFDAALPPAEFALWANACRNAIEAHGEVLTSLRDLGEATEDRKDALQKIARALTACGLANPISTDLDDLLTSSQNAIDAASVLTGAETALKKAQDTLARRKSARETAEKNLACWSTKWRKTIDVAWIGHTHPDAGVTLVGEILDLLKDLDAHSGKHDDFDTRIKSMRRNQSLYAEAVDVIAKNIGEDADGRSTLGLADKIAVRIKAAGDAKTQYDMKKGDIERERKTESELIAAHEAAKVQQIPVLAQIGAESLEDASKTIAYRAKKAELEKQRRGQQRLVQTTLGVETFDEARSLIAATDRSSLAGDKSQAQALYDDADTKLQDAHARKSEAERKIRDVGGDDAVARLEEQRRTLLIEIEERARHWLRLRAGLLAAEQALRAYREKHRTSMLTTASDAFSTISRGAYQKLTTTPHKDGEKLVGVPKLGQARDADAMSKGTQYQLYLALRVAGYHEYAAARTPPAGVPFIADDIMETFDNKRAGEAFGVLAKMARFGQVIYLTHHEHLCSIAEKVCPDVRLHRIA